MECRTGMKDQDTFPTDKIRERAADFVVILFSSLTEALHAGGGEALGKSSR